MTTALLRVLLISVVCSACSRQDDVDQPFETPPLESSLTEISVANPLPVQTESASVTDRSRWGQLLFDRNDIRVVNSGDSERVREIADLIERYHRHWLDQDNESIRRLYHEDVVRLRGGRVVHGLTDVMATIADESRGERPSGYATSMQLSLYSVRIDIRKEVAVAFYRVAVHAGARWEYADIATVMQVILRVDEDWKILAHMETSRLGDPSAPPLADDVPDRRAPVRFDFVYPAKDLDRAIDFYAPLLGDPQFVAERRASFRLGDAYFELEVDPLNRRVLMKEGYANGYAIFDVPHFGVVNGRMSESEWSEAVVTDCGRDRCAITEDPSGNVVVWRRDQPHNVDEAVWPTVSFMPGHEPAAEIGDDVTAMMTDWISADADAVVERLSPNAVWIDDADRIAGNERSIRRSLSARWRSFVQGPDGIDGDIIIRNLKVQSIGNHWLVTFTAEVEMRTDPRDSFAMHLMQLWSGRESARVTDYVFCGLARPLRNVPVSSMDYIAYPAVDLGAAGRYYKILLGSEPYRDANWFGFWSTSSVFGLVGQYPDKDAFKPTPHRANGYADFSVRSIDEVYAYLRKKGATFPLVPGINDTAGVDSQPGYKQILAVDSEGNLVNFSQYLEY